LAQHLERLAKLMAFHVEMFGKVTLGRKLAAALLQAADRCDDVVEIR
jgi:hypothetical protein